MKGGLFVGLTTLDLIYGVPHLPQANEKQVATALSIAAGGPATNAAVAFSFLGNVAQLCSGMGQHPVTALLREDLHHHRVKLWDLLPYRLDPPPLSSILVTQADQPERQVHKGERAVVCRNALNWQAAADGIPPNVLEGIQIVLLDGHQMAVGGAIATLAQQQHIPVVLDGGSWKPGLEAILPLVTYAICSANFFPPTCSTRSAVMQYLKARVPYSAITDGHQPIHYATPSASGLLAVPPIEAVDTLGAGDIFHGAFCHWILHTDFVTALQQASRIAAHACQFFGTRQWMQQPIALENPTLPHSINLDSIHLD